MDYIGKVNLSYKELENGENLYDDVNLMASDIIPAEYWKNPIGVGNPDICALPRPAGTSELLTQNTVPICGYDPAAPEKMKLWERKQSLLGLKQVRFPFVFHGQIENLLSISLISAYQSRRLAISGRYKGEGTETILSSGQNISSNVQGFSIIGTSGCGKSTAFQLTAAKYPRAIHHSFDTYSYVQIPIVRLTAYANGNLRALFISMSQQLDEILDTGTRHYDQMRRNDIGKMAALICDWIRIYHIGLIAIDEIQLMDFNPHSAKSFENLLTITAATGVALAVIGTEDAMDSWSRLLRIQRRTESSIVKADEYCHERPYMNSIIRHLWKYQWVTPRVELTQEAMDALYEESLGSIDLLTSLWMMVQFDALEKKGSVIDAEFIRRVSHKRFSRMKQLVKESQINSECNFAQEREVLLKGVRTSAEEEREKELKKALEDKMENEMKMSYDRDIVLGKIMESIQCCYDGFSDAAIKRAFTKAEKDEDFGRLKIPGMTKRVLSYLIPPQKTVRKPKKPESDRVAELERGLKESLEVTRKELPA